MFGWLKKRASTPNELSALAQSATSDIRDRWLYFTKTIHFREDVPLAKRIESFATPIQEFLRVNYPGLKDAPAGVFWMMLVTAIAEAKTHESAELDRAVEQLRARYGPQ
jgi:hypothetical protein